MPEQNLSVQNAFCARHVERKCRNGHPKRISAIVEHFIIARHCSGWSLKRTSGNILIAVIRTKGRLFANHARPLNLLGMSVLIDNPPVPRNQLHRAVRSIDDGDPVRPDMSACFRVGLVRPVPRLGSHFDKVGGCLVQISPTFALLTILSFCRVASIWSSAAA